MSAWRSRTHVVVALLLFCGAVVVLLLPLGGLPDGAGRPHGRPVGEERGRPQSDSTPALRGLAEREPRRSEPSPNTASQLLAGRVIRLPLMAAVEGARVFIDPGEHAHVPADATVRSNANGMFEIPVSKPGSYQVKVMAEGLLPWSGEILTAGSAPPHEVVLHPGATIRGRTVSWDGAALGGVAVRCAEQRQRVSWPHQDTLFPAGGCSGSRTTSDADGGFLLSGLTQDVEYEVYASKDGWVRTGSVFPPLVQARTDGLVIVMQRITDFWIRVLSEDGRVLTDRAFVDIAFQKGWGHVPAYEEGIRTRRLGESSRSHDGRSDSRDWFTFRLVPEPGTDASEGPGVEVYATAFGYHRAQVQQTITAASGNRIDVRLRPKEPGVHRSEVRFRAAFPSGTPVRGRYTSELRGWDGRRESVLLKFDEGGVTDRALCLPRGEYEIVIGPGLDPGCDRFYPMPEKLQFSVVPSAEPLIVDVPCAGSILHLDVLAPSGEPVGGFDVRVQGVHAPRGWGNWHALWDFAEGFSEPILLVGEGTTRLQVDMPGVGGARIDVEAPGDGKELSVSIELHAAKEVRWREILRRHENMGR